ncbi:Homeobox-leucine zipper protein like [Quillaja saponaria]|uniref:Homeobox-leucine zipper protein n=1 Tax=Quillaja saponaria TaxID=32244 RepID=A0AAD7QHV0_QUISA|nr:Homeobox-leucine zipper protein like [Quillaja saponaria]
MDLFPTQNQKYPPKHNKKRLTQDQMNILETSFTSDKKLVPERKLMLANLLGVPPRQIAIWYQNKRARWKTQSLEFQYSTLKLKLENALMEKKKLERDVEWLKAELKKAQDMLLGVKERDPNVCNSFSSTTTSFEEVGSFGLHENVNGLWENNNGEVLQLDELYACLMGANG